MYIVLSLFFSFSTISFHLHNIILSVHYVQILHYRDNIDSVTSQIQYILTCIIVNACKNVLVYYI